MSIQVKCKHCQCLITIPPCREWRTHYCSDECRKKAKDLVKESRKKFCLVCNKEFYPRKTQIDMGNGKYCSKKCRHAGILPALLSDESKRKSKETYLKNLKNGKIKHPKGKDNPRWMGGEIETRKRQIESGKSRERNKKYRKENPEKVREWTAKRKNAKIGRLPKGTIKSKKEIQNNKCVYCKTDISITFHVDHIIPLAKGGTHEPNNIQILCPTCNLRKSDKLDFKYEEIK